MKRSLIFNPAIHATSFVLLFDKGSTGGSWTIRDYSEPEKVQVRYAREFDISLTALRRTHQFIFPAPANPTGDLAFWHDHIQQLNAQHLKNDASLTSAAAEAKPVSIILASSSPRRRELLTEANIAFTVDSIAIDESPRHGESPIVFTQRLAREKAEPIFKKNPKATVLGADTIVVCDEEILGKPVDAQDAARMLRLLSNRSHQVITGVAVLSPQGKKTQAGITTVTMREISEEEIQNYIATGEPMDKAGAYAIQGGAAPFITNIKGDYTNVVGLPIKLVQQMLAGK